MDCDGLDGMDMVLATFAASVSLVLSNLALCVGVIVDDMWMMICGI